MDENGLKLAVLEAAGWAREELRNADIGSTMEFRICVKVPIQEQSVGFKIEYSVETSYEMKVEGSSPMAIVHEFLRRRGWTAANKPIEIEYRPPDSSVPA